MSENKLKKPRQDYGKGSFGIGIYMPKTSENVGTLIRSAKMFGASYVFMIGKRYQKQRSAVSLSTKIPIFYFKDWDTFKESIPPTKKITVVELTEASTKLAKYKHQKTGVYLLGAEDYGIPNIVLHDERCEFVEIEGESSLNVAVAGSILLYDRYVKLNDL